MVPQDTNIYKSLNITINPRNFIIGADFCGENIYLKESEDDKQQVDEVKLAEQKLAGINSQIERKKREILEIEKKELLELEQKKINILKETEELKTELMESAKSQIEIQKQTGYQIGYDDGYKQAMTEFKAETQDKLLLLNSIIETINKEKKAKALDLRDEIYEIIKSFVNHIIEKEIETYKDDILIKNLTELLSEINGAKELVIKVNPANVEKIKNLKNMISGEVSSLEKLKVTSSQNIDEVSCILETDKGNFDATLKVRLESLFDSLKQTISEM
ncbi:MAG TPA: FliH/SctL family protein [bacterium]|nr:FliH/SctL family protein [bacterium]